MKKIQLSLLAPLLLLAVPTAARADSDPVDPPPPPATSQPTWLFSWTNNPSALADPVGHVTGELAYAGDCVRKISDSIHAGKDEQIKNCEGNRMAAGPGIYVCDNPFTSHDYGGTVLMMRSKAGDKNIANTSGTVSQASGGVDRSIFGNTSYDAIFYDFRSADDGGYALAIRKPDLLDVGKSAAIQVPSGDRKEWHFHDSFACTANTSVSDVLARWGDQLEFLALTFDNFRDPTQKDFKKPSGELSNEGLMAALSSNIVAVPDADLAAKIKKLTAANAELKDALSTASCEEADHMSPRVCLSYELFDSLVDNEGTPNYPNHYWHLPALKAGLQSLGIITAAQAAQFKTRETLMAFLAQRFPTDPYQLKRAQEAYGCMKAVKDQLHAASLAKWPESSK